MTTVGDNDFAAFLDGTGLDIERATEGNVTPEIQFYDFLTEGSSGHMPKISIMCYNLKIILDTLDEIQRDDNLKLVSEDLKGIVVVNRDKRVRALIKNYIWKHYNYRFQPTSDGKRCDLANIVERLMDNDEIQSRLVKNTKPLPGQSKPMVAKKS